MLLDQIGINDSDLVAVEREVDREIPDQSSFATPTLLARQGQHRHIDYPINSDAQAFVPSCVCSTEGQNCRALRAPNPNPPDSSEGRSYKGVAFYGKKAPVQWIRKLSETKG